MISFWGLSSKATALLIISKAKKLLANQQQISNQLLQDRYQTQFLKMTSVPWNQQIDEFKKHILYPPTGSHWESPRHAQPLLPHQNLGRLVEPGLGPCFIIGREMFPNNSIHDSMKFPGQSRYQPTCAVEGNLNQLSRISKFIEELGNYSNWHVAKLKLTLQKKYQPAQEAPRKLTAKS